MPRLPSSIIIKAYQRHSLLPLLLSQCRTIDSAQNELRWLQERVRCMQNELSSRTGAASGRHVRWNKILRSMCRARSKGLPLQYIIGDQPFGDLEILCRKGVLIPRTETESFTLHAAQLALKHFKDHVNAENAGHTRRLRILDLCSGTGCMSLLLHSVLAQHIGQISSVGIDLSPTAVKLASDNLAHNLQLGLLSARARTEIHFRQGNVLAARDTAAPGVEDVLREFPEYASETGPRCDILVANPPYVAPQSFWDGTTARSVRIFEPRLALVPPSPGDSLASESVRQEDVFYYEIIHLAFRLCPQLVLLECGSRLQAERVVRIYDDLAGELRQGRPFETQILPGWDPDPDADVSGESGACAVILQQPTYSD
ncbi:S-adenosyl-L-methionine-dependent methyltransferase [Aspergillus ambiguus]|uniref:S-adenosyl-L-methionine-dependent methyltransferase n=1 Tax=Aspergillus ambiguus TaxID=176160 RepID=UPI003CCE4ABA